MSRRLLDDRVGMKHGAGGPAMRLLIEEVLTPGLVGDQGATPDSEAVGLIDMDDGAAFRLGEHWLVLTTDSHVVQPRFFPGGDIGRLAVAGTVNDLAVMGATRVLGLTCGLIVEEGFSFAELERIQASIAATCREAEAPLLTGDTKVMGRGEIDGLVLNTSGLGLADRVVRTGGLRPGDRIIVSGTIGDHGLAVMAVRKQLDIVGDLRSDVAPIGGLVRRALEVGGRSIVAMTDPTRGGLASALVEMAGRSEVGVLLDEAAVPVDEPVRAASELLGIDPLHVANEGKLVLGVRAEAADEVLAALREHPQGKRAAIIGTAIREHGGRVLIDTGFGRRLLSEPEGELLPRIC